MVRRFLIVFLVAGPLVLPAGCASKKFVQVKLEKSEKQVGQRLGMLETTLSQEKDRLSRVGSQVTEVLASADEANRQADQAASKAAQAFSTADRATGMAEQALAKGEETDSRLRRLRANRYKRDLVETVVITFGFDKWELDDAAQTALVDAVKELMENPTLMVDLEGHTDSVGSARYNLELSQRRTEAVRRFLVEKGVDLPRIQSIGAGEVHPVADNTARDGRAQNRRVVIKLFIPTD